MSITNNGIEKLTAAAQTPAGTNLPAVTVTNLTLPERETFAGTRFYAEVDLEVSGNSSVYYIYQMPALSSGVVVALQRRDFKNENGRVDIDILWNSTGYTIGTAVPIFNENRNSSKTPQMTINAITAPSNEGIIRERDFIASGAGFFNSSGAISSELGFRLYSPESFFVLKVTNQEAGAQRVHVGYSWYEIPEEELDLNT